jgi:hypothetical protein
MIQTVEAPNARRPLALVPRNGTSVPPRPPRESAGAAGAENESQGWITVALHLFGWRF